MAARRKGGFFTRWLMPLLLGLLATAGALIVGNATLVPAGKSRPPSITDFGRPAAPVAAAAPAAKPHGSRVVVDIGNTPPPGVRTGAAVNDPLLAGAPKVGRAPPPQFDVVFRRVTVLDASHFRVVRDNKPVIVGLAGVGTLPFDAVCSDDAGTRWKCGARARAELARIIGPRLVGCVEVREEGDTAITADCYAADESLADWMVSQGWIDPLDPYDQRFRSLADDARQTHKGRLQTAPRPLP